MTTTTQIAAPAALRAANTRNSFGAMVKKNGFLNYALILLGLVILGPLYSVVLVGVRRKWCIPR